jgi:hypothetical protein
VRSLLLALPRNIAAEVDPADSRRAGPILERELRSVRCRTACSGPI